MKAICVLEAVLRKKDDKSFSVISSYFSDNKEVVVQCCESPQASLREKANKVRFLFLFRCLAIDKERIGRSFKELSRGLSILLS